MFARVLDSVWRENVEAARRVWDRVSGRDRDETHERSRARAAADQPLTYSGTRYPSTSAAGRRSHRRVIGGTAAAVAVLALTYSAASALVNGAAGSSSARSDYLTVLQAASAEYRRARAECLALAVERRDVCIAEAHANESKMRNTAFSAPRKQLAQLRRKSDDVLLAAQALGSIVIEPACNVVARGAASVCEIQVRGSAPESQEALASSRALAARTSPVGEDRAVLARWLSGPQRDHDRYLTNVAALVSP